ncbi:hypothetical protein ACFFQF_02565 [Haladaptatus pallidirubidus]|uniref:ZIP Zinc transporter n=1 Tax=Haladaptatus pallidirubidus TaxID=1008152 RepID=A0AAV3UB52_9EURY|nr:hypothetical protein [Haladaptatus pallidirubidus]
MTFLPGLLAFLLALVHLVAGNVQSFRAIPRSSWLSAAGGASVAYVFVHLLPELKGGTVLASVPILVGFFERHVYIVALVGFSLFYGLEVLAREFGHDGRRTADEIFWLHIGSFTAYNALIGYLLVHREQPGQVNLLLYAVAMGLHFVVNDYGLREFHEASYDRLGRWFLAGAVVVGWAVGNATEVDEAVVNTLFAFLAGGIILNIIKEELPEERESRFWAFAVGAGSYTLLLLFV